MDQNCSSVNRFGTRTKRSSFISCTPTAAGQPTSGRGSILLLRHLQLWKSQMSAPSLFGSTADGRAAKVSRRTFTVLHTNTACRASHGLR